MSDRHTPRAVEDYTAAFLTTAGVLVFMLLWTIASVAGTIWVAVAVWLIDCAITVLGRWRNRAR